MSFSSTQAHLLAICGLVLCAMLALGGCIQGETDPEVPELASGATATVSTASPSSTAETAMLRTTATPRALTTAADTSTVTSTVTTTIIATARATVCPPRPLGWSIYTVQQYDTLSDLAFAIDASIGEIQVANCLDGDIIVMGQPLYLPRLPVPTVTPTPAPTRCGPPADWVDYLVQTGDTLSELALATNVDEATIRLANCLESDTIYAGRSLSLPFRPNGVAAPRLPAARPAGIAQGPTMTPTADCSIPFTCANEKVSELTTPGVIPNATLLCANPTITTTHIEIGQGNSRLSAGARVTLGERTFFAGCSFADPEQVKVTLILPDQTRIPLPMSTAMTGERTYARATWLPVCNLDTLVDYEVIVEDGQSPSISRKFKVMNPARQQILAIPEAGPRGWFDLYFCGYSSFVGKPPIQIELHSGIQIDPDQCEFSKVRVESLPINEEGWAHTSVYLPLPGETATCYLVKNQDPSLSDRTYIKIVR